MNKRLALFLFFVCFGMQSSLGCSCCQDLDIEKKRQEQFVKKVNKLPSEVKNLVVNYILSSLLYYTLLLTKNPKRIFVDDAEDKRMKTVFEINELGYGYVVNSIDTVENSIQSINGKFKYFFYLSSILGKNKEAEDLLVTVGIIHLGRE